ncbi:DGAT1/2-independent enzyme synthesizing storage lipids isoform X2 [Plodia interpunctella]|uniref:DGAT1/2-independent enzyme synthesizing storage lipids isoform X2 n=1 Tax=Plodia interpunctella TaxID=58824 RepID=UPI00236742E5|nr:transmembrane protein 68 isoform X2 [Plodia interpunctella]
MVESQCVDRTVKAYIMSDLLKKFDIDATHDIVKIAIAVAGFYMGIFYLEYVDAEYSLWLTWFLTPVIVTFLLPGFIIVLIYMSSIIFHLYRLYRLRVVAGVHNDWKEAARLAVCALWDAHGWLWHGYEIRGLENIPDGPFLIIYYHGALPIDMYYFTARMLLFKRRHIHTVADRFMFKIPGWASLLEGLCVIPGTVSTCAGVLRGGNPLAISPGGVYEAQFGDHEYRLHWKSRIGFAKVAQEAKVPVVPMFTQNVREAFRTVGWLRGACRRVYAASRLPLTPVYGGFPVKLVTHLGAPIAHDPALTPEQLQRKVADAIEKLIDEHQRVPGNILLALMERVIELPKHLKHKSKTSEKGYTNGKCHNGKLKEKSDSSSEKCERDSVDKLAC